jgi:hypothetical protein
LLLLAAALFEVQREGFAMTVITQPLAAARSVERLLTAAKERLLDTESEARDGRLISIAQWIRERIESLDGGLLREVRATVEVLERRQAKEIEALETAHRAAASGFTPVITRSPRDLAQLAYFPARPLQRVR